MNRFHLSSDTLAVVQHHPQAESEFAKEQGYVVLRFEPWTLLEFRVGLVAWLNSASQERLALLPNGSVPGLR